MTLLLYVVALTLGWLVWLVLSEINHRRYLRKYNEQTERLYPTRRPGQSE